MKKTIFTLAVATSLIASTMITSCQSSEKKVENAEEKVMDANQDLKEVKQDSTVQAQKKATAEQWRIFKKESDVKISYNEIRIKELKTEKKKLNKTMGELYESKIDALELKNHDMKARMEAYEKSQSDWDSFKIEFNHDMDELGSALKDLTVKNVK